MRFHFPVCWISTGGLGTVVHVKESDLIMMCVYMHQAFGQNKPF